MWKFRNLYDKESNPFFRIALAHNDLAVMYRTNFTLFNNFNWSLHELENMMPWEKDVYISLLAEKLKEDAK